MSDAQLLVTTRDQAEEEDTGTSPEDSGDHEDLRSRLRVRNRASETNYRIKSGGWS